MHNQQKPKPIYRLALDLGTTSIGWAIFRLKAEADHHLAPTAILKAGVRIFSDGRNPKDGSSLAVTRREARSQRRRRDRLLKRKARMLQQLTAFGFFPENPAERKALETQNPYALRAKGLDEALTPAEFGRALFHINQRRGFKSNRKTDKKENDGSALKAAIQRIQHQIDGVHARTVGELLHKRMLRGESVRARYREAKVQNEDGKTNINKSYDLYINRDMVEAEFEALWTKQAELNPTQYHIEAKTKLKDVLLFQRNLRPVKPGRCTLMPTEKRAPLALPSTQRFRIYQEANNLRILDAQLNPQPLTLEQRNTLVAELEQKNKLSFIRIKNLLGLNGQTQFNLEDAKHQEIKGNTTSAILSKPEHFGKAWFNLSEQQQDDIVLQILHEENESTLTAWLMQTTDINEQQAETVANVGLPEGYGSLSQQALAKILPELQKSVITYDKAVVEAGFKSHSQLGEQYLDFDIEEAEELCNWVHPITGEIKPAFKELPYYGRALHRHVGFGSNNTEDPIEKRYGKIANPTVHIGLNQVRKVVNALIKKYGHPAEVIVEVARDLKQSKKQRDEENKRQAANQRRNDRIRKEIANMRGILEDNVKRHDIQKWILWEELSFDIADRKCPYSGVQINAEMLLSDEVEIEHILPFSQTLDDSLNNKTVALTRANREKGNKTPWEAFGQGNNTLGVTYDDILARAQRMPLNKRYRFAEDAMQQWNKEGDGFLARALNDTRYLSRIAREYLTLVCPQGTRVIPGQMTAQLREKLGLNSILGPNGEKNRNDHRHHAVDACVIGITDQGMLQRFAEANKAAKKKGLDRLVETMPEPWPTYREHVQRAIDNIWVSHKPDHGHEGAMHNDTAYGLLGDGLVRVHKMVDGQRTAITEKLNVIPFACEKAKQRHGTLPNGEPRPYKGYKGDSNYCIEIVRNQAGEWEGEVISTYQAYQVVRTASSKEEGLARLRHPTLSQNGKPLVMRILRDDTIRLEHAETLMTVRLTKMSTAGQLAFAEIHESNVDARTRTKELAYIFKTGGSLQKAKARPVSISPIGILLDQGFKN